MVLLSAIIYKCLIKISNFFDIYNFKFSIIIYESLKILYLVLIKEIDYTSKVELSKETHEHYLINFNMILLSFIL